MNTIVFATLNPGKMKEIKAITEAAGFSVISMREAGCETDIPEDGASFAENALIKARAVATQTGSPAMADDSGLEIDYLDKAPGVYSARYLGKDTPYAVKNQKILEMLKNVPAEQRTARFVCAMAFVDTNGIVITAEASLEGAVAFAAAGDGGFGYDPIFYIPELRQTSAQLNADEKNAISHRGKALRLLIEKVREHYAARIGDAVT